MAKITLGLYGGTFSPPHIGHRRIAEAFISQCGLDELIIMPASVPPHKEVSFGDDPEKRLIMAHIAFGDLSKAKISRLELDREGKSYTVYTLRDLFDVYALERGRDRIRLLVGADMFLSLDTWYLFREIFELAVIVYAGRGNTEEDRKLSEKAEYYQKTYGAVTEELILEPFKVSSSEIRDMIKTGKDTGEFLSGKVYGYIRAEGLYGMEKTEITEEMLSMLRLEVSQRLSEKRFSHTLAVEEEAVFIAERLIPEKIVEIRAAAILHDVAKELSSEKQLNYINGFGIIKNTSEDIPEPILHAMAAPAVIVREFPEYARGNILSAVRRHTTGAVGMSAFDAVIFIADYIEPTRKHETCRACREYFHGNIDRCETKAEKLSVLTEAVKISLYDTLCFIRRRGTGLDPDTERTYEWLRDGGSFANNAL